MRRERLTKRLEGERRALLESFYGLPDEALLNPGVVGPWSVRDVMAHITTWEEEALKSLPLILKGKSLPRYSSQYGGIDAFNALEQERKRDFSLHRIRQEFAATHQLLMAFVAGVPESAYAAEGRFLRRLRWDSYSHYREHSAQISAWRTELKL